MVIFGTKYSLRDFLLLSILIAAPVYSHWHYLSSLDPNYFLGPQLTRHQAVLERTSPSPWVYRQLSEWAVSPFVHVSELLTNSPTIGFLSFRLFLQLVIFVGLRELAINLKSNWLVSWMIMSILMSTATFDSDLSFNTYTEIAFAVLIVNINFFGRVHHRRKRAVLLLLSILAVLNRETILILLAAILAVDLFSIAPKYPKYKSSAFIKTLISRFDLLFVGIGTFLLVRLLIGSRPPMVPYGIHFGFETLSYNLRLESIDKPMVFWIIFIVFILVGDYFTTPYRTMCAFLLAIWIPVHLIGSFLVESRVLLVPASLITPLLFRTDLISYRSAKREIS
jgi:hypothetical protein